MHAETEREIREFVGRVAEPAFLKRYGVELTAETWLDRHGRDFWTGVFLWVGN